MIQVPSANHYAGRSGYSPIAICLHTMSGTLGQTDNWFRDPTNQDSSAHYGVNLQGVVHQYVQITDGAWGNGVVQSGNYWIGPAGVNPNFLTVSIETEDLGNPNQPVTDAMFNAVWAIANLAIQRYPSIKYLVSHKSISPIDRPNCPGKARWYDSGRFNQLATTLNLKPVF